MAGTKIEKAAKATNGKEKAAKATNGKAKAETNGKAKEKSKTTKVEETLKFAPTYTTHNTIGHITMYYALAKLAELDGETFGGAFEAIRDSILKGEGEKVPISMNAGAKLILHDIAVGIHRHGEKKFKPAAPIAQAVKMVLAYEDNPNAPFAPGMTKELMQIITDNKNCRLYHMFLMDVAAQLAVLLSVKTKEEDGERRPAAQIMHFMVGQAIHGVCLHRGLLKPNEVTELVQPLIRGDYPEKLTDDEIKAIRADVKARREEEAAARKKAKKSASGGSSSKASLCSDATAEDSDEEPDEDDEDSD